MKISKKVLFFTFFILCVTSNITFAKTGKVKIEATRIREEANVTSNIITVIYEDDEVEILDESGDWYKIKYKENTGFVKKEFLTVKEENKTNTVNNTINTSNESANNIANNTNTSSEQNNVAEVVNQEAEENNEQTTLYINTDTFIKVLPSFCSQDIVKFEVSKQVQKLAQFNNWVQVTDGIYTGWIVKVKAQTDAVTVPEPKEEESEPVENNNNNTVANETTNNTNTNTVSNTIANSSTASNNSVNKKAIITVETANVRKSPTETSERIGTLDYGDEVTLLEQEGSWYKINFENQSGYLKNTLLKVTDDTVSSRGFSDEREENTVYDVQNKEIVTTNKGNEVVKYAKQYLGCKYVVGGKSPSTGFDCSGFTRYVYLNFGYSLGSTSSSQRSAGTEVSRNDLIPGDLILFLGEDKSGIGHTGIYIGGGEFIHAANPQRGVVIDNLNTNSYYNERFVEARRIVN